MERLFGMSASWEVRQGLEEWEPEMHIDKELRVLNTFFNNMLFSLKSDLLFLAQLPRGSSFSFLLILLRAWNLEQWGLRWPKASQWWQTMCLGLLGFLGRDLVIWFCSLFNLWHRSYMTNHTTIVASWNKLRSIQNLRFRPKWRLWVDSFSLHLLISFMWRNVYRFVL